MSCLFSFYRVWNVSPQYPCLIWEKHGQLTASSLRAEKVLQTDRSFIFPGRGGWSSKKCSVSKLNPLKYFQIILPSPVLNYQILILKNVTPSLDEAIILSFADYSFPFLWATLKYGFRKTDLGILILKCLFDQILDIHFLHFRTQ